MKAGYTIEQRRNLPTKDTTHILVYNWHFLNEVDMPSYSFKSHSEIEERPCLDKLVAIFKIKPKCSEKKSS